MGAKDSKFSVLPYEDAVKRGKIPRKERSLG